MAVSTAVVDAADADAGAGAGAGADAGTAEIVHEGLAESRRGASWSFVGEQKRPVAWVHRLFQTGWTMNQASVTCREQRQDEQEGRNR